MKKRILPLLLFFILISGSQLKLTAQNLYFCEGVDDNGYPKNESTVFTIQSGGGSLYFLVRLPYEVGCTYVNYYLYTVDYNERETYSTTIKQEEMGTNWSWFWKKITFYETGTYKVYVYDCNNRMLVSSTIKIKYRD